MREFQEKKRFRKYLYSKTSVAILLVLIIFFAHATWELYGKERESEVNIVHATNQLQTLKDRQTSLSSEIDRLNTQEGVEEEIRAKYSIAKPGEQLVIIVDQNQASTTPQEPKNNWWQKFKNLFK